MIYPSKLVMNPSDTSKQYGQNANSFGARTKHFLADHVWCEANMRNKVRLLGTF